MSQMQRLGKLNTSIFTDDEGYTCIILYHTVVVKFNNVVIMLDHGGYKTNTTKTRMNQASNQFNLGFYVYQKNGEWFVSKDNIDSQFIGSGVTLLR